MVSLLALTACSPREDQEEEQEESKEGTEKGAEATPIPEEEKMSMEKWQLRGIEPISFTYANFPPASTFPCVQMEEYKRKLEEYSDGQITVETHPGGTLLGAKNIFEGVKSGVADIGCFAMSYHPGQFPLTQVMDLPLGFPNAKAPTMLLYDMYKMHTPAEFDDVVVLTLFTCPPAAFMTTKPIETLDDLKGYKLRVSGTGVGVIKALGGEPDGMPMSETPEAIQKGRVKGIVSSMEILKDFNFASYTPHVSPANLHVVTFAVVMNRKKWDSLPEQVQVVMRGMGRSHAAWTADYVDQHVDEALEWSKEKYDIKIHTLSTETREEMNKRFQPLFEAYVESANKAGLDGDAILKQVVKMKPNYEAKYLPTP